MNKMEEKENIVLKNLGRSGKRIGVRNLKKGSKEEKKGGKWKGLKILIVIKKRIEEMKMDIKKEG